jgi:ADP-ribosylglycohydrolase
MAKDILDAVYGSVVGAAIGDALGAPVEGWYWTEIRAKYGRVTELMPSLKGNVGATYGGSTGELYDQRYDGPPGRPGQVTDDTTLGHYIALAIIGKNGRITPDDLAQVLIAKLNPNRFWINEKIILWKLKAGMNPWDVGKGSVPAGCGMVGIGPIGIINAGNPAQAYQDAFNIAFVDQDGDNRDAAGTLAAGVAEAFVPGVTIERVLDVMLQHSAYVVRRAIELTMDLAYASDSVDAFAERFYAKMLDWTWPSRGWRKERYFSGSALEIVPATMGILHLVRGDVNQALIEGASFGRDCDTIPRAAASIAGAMQGASAIRPDWIETVESANVDLFAEVENDPQADFYSIAKRLVAALRSERERALERAATLGRILG